MESGFTHPFVSVGMHDFQFLVNGYRELLRLTPMDDYNGDDEQEWNTATVFEKVPDAPTHVHSVHAGSAHGVIIDGNRQCWSLGVNLMGEVGVNPMVTNKLSSPFKIDSFELPIHHVGCGDAYTICIDFEGSVWSLGNMWFYPQETDGYSSFVPVKIPSGDTSVAIDVACEVKNFLILTSEGTLQTPQPAPRNNNNNDRRRQTEDTWALTTIPGIDSIVSISSGHMHTLALSRSGRMWLFNSDDEEPPDDGSVTILRSDPIEGRFRYFQEINLENIPFRIKHIKCSPYDQVLCIDHENNLRVLNYNHRRVMSLDPDDRKSILSVPIDSDLSSLFPSPNRLRRIASGLGDVMNEHIGVDEQGFCWLFSVEKMEKRQLTTSEGDSVRIGLYTPYERYNPMRGG